jgi:hypothetical protein
MTTHVTDETLVDLALGAGAAEAREHAAGCAACARRVEELREALELASGAEVPEPAAFYWQALRQGVSQRIANERHLARRFAVFVPLTAAAAVAAVLLAGHAVPRRQPAAPALQAWSALPAEENDSALQVLEGLAIADGGISDWEPQSGLAAYVAGLTEDESRALAAALRQPQQGGGS